MGPFLLQVELPDVGDDVLADVPFAEFETAEEVLSLTPPVDGAVVAANARILDAREPLAAIPLEERWLVRLRPSEPLPEGGFLSAEDYRAFAEEA